MLVGVQLAFEFRKAKVEWSQARARLTGFAKRADGTVDGDNLMAEITTGGMRRSILYPRRWLPEGDRECLWLTAYSDREVADIFSAFNPLLLVPSGETHMQDEESRSNTKLADAWQLREAFMRVGHTPEKLLAFLNEWGRWNSEAFVEPSEIIDLQQAIREALLTAPAKWFTSPYPLPFNWRRCPEFPYFALLTDSAEVALRMTVSADLLNQARFRICARPDCGQPFKVETNHDKKFCSRACAHLVVVRRSQRVATGVPAKTSTRKARVLKTRPQGDAI
jgi:hypothetical protein